MPFKGIIILIQFMFLDINMFWALPSAHFSPRQTARAKVSLSRTQNISMPENKNSIACFNTEIIQVLFEFVRWKSASQYFSVAI